VPMLDLAPAAHEVERLLRGVSDDRLGDPTPCADIPVAGLLDHIMGLTLAFTWAANKQSPPGGGPTGPGLASSDNLDPDWRAQLPRRLSDLVAAWRDPTAWEGTTEAGGVRMPAEIMGLVALDELVMHGWDLARATGQSFTCDPASTEAVLAFTSESARPERADSRDGLFGPVVEVPEDAPAFDRALGYAGRDPAWTPASA
jgi:uncharacterized protein (TIGR03086 family)